jgi:Ras GTPase-activating-like protein IQGAP2/3
MAPIPSLKPGGSVHSRAQSFDAAAAAKKQNDATQQPPSLSRAISRRDPGTNYGARPWTQDGALPHQPSLLDDGDLEKLGRSATGHLRTISKLAEEGVDQELAIRTKEHEVVGLHGRRKLQGNMVTKERPLQAPGYGGRIWLDQQRQFLQAYEYLCHIGEAKEWIQDVMRREIPAIVQLEEHLRDGVTLAELVQSLHPERPLRIFRNAKLQFRHSDNIAIFFNFLAEIELPELFRFELVDLYEKKNIPKVIYCIHALSWLLFRKGIVDFKIGNLVGQLEFEQHELENMQKGLDQSGISMPNFSGLRPEPVEPVETEDDRIDRELQQHTDSIQDFQAQLRGALLRLRLGEQMQVLFENEDLILDLQARLRGDWSRQVHGYQLEMKTFATKLQSAVRAYIARTNQKDKARNWQHHESDVVRIQALVRARQARKQTQLLKSNTRQHTTGVVEVQAAIRGALKRLHLGEHYTHVHEHEASTVDLQRHIRGYIQRQRHEQRARDFESLEPVWAALQGHARGMLVRTRKKARSTQLDTHAVSILSLQTQVRARRVRMEISQRQADLAGRQAPVTELQSALRAFLVRKRIAYYRNPKSSKRRYISRQIVRSVGGDERAR